MMLWNSVMVAAAWDLEKAHCPATALYDDDGYPFSNARPPSCITALYALHTHTHTQNIGGGMG